MDQQRRDEDKLQRLQVAAALVVGVVLLLGIVVRAYLGNVLPVGWWRP